MLARKDNRVAGIAVVALLGHAPLGCDGASPADGRAVLRLGYFPTLLHAPAIVALERGFFAEELGPDVRLEAVTLQAGPAAVTALFSGALDLAYLGPNPTINAYLRSGGEAIRVVAGAASGGAALVVRPEIRAAADLRGRRVATPQLGNTQDVALRAWLGERGFRVTREGGDVEIVQQTGARAFESFRDGTIQGAWMPEPWASRLQLEGGGHALVDEADLWPDRRFVTTQIVARTQYLREHGDRVVRLLRAHVRAVEALTDHPVEAQAAVQRGLARLTGRALSPDVLRAAWSRVAFTLDPLASTLRRCADNARRVGLLDGEADLRGLYALDSLGTALRSLGRSATPIEVP